MTNTLSNGCGKKYQEKTNIGIVETKCGWTFNHTDKWYCQSCRDKASERIKCLKEECVWLEREQKFLIEKTIQAETREGTEIGNMRIREINLRLKGHREQLTTLQQAFGDK